MSFLNKDLIKATLRLFNSVPVGNKDSVYKERNLVRQIKNGYIVDNRILPVNELLTVIEDVIGISGEKANATFHKSWHKIANASIEQLVVEQIIHYITVYGFQAVGIYDEDTIYIPNEALDIPDVTFDTPLTVIKPMTRGELFDAILTLDATGIALSQETLDDIMTIVKYNVDYPSAYVRSLRNRELKALLQDFYNLAPSDPEEFVRYVVAKLTDESLIVKNRVLVEKIKASNGKFLDTLMKDAPDDLASVFYRYKPLFLAMKSISRDKTFYNRLRKDAPKMHKPVKQSYLNTVTDKIKSGELNLTHLNKSLKTAGLVQKVRLANALQFRLSNPDSIVYQVRTGRGYATEFYWSGSRAETQIALGTVIASIGETLHEKVADKVVYIPEGVNYSIPTSEKQFVGNIPVNSYVAVKGDFVVGIHWFNKEDKVVDLDLSLQDTFGKFGWDAKYRNGNVLFSGDITSAPRPNGATEVFHVSGSYPNKTMSVTYFNQSRWHGDPDEVDCKVIVGRSVGNARTTKYNHLVDQNKLVFQANVHLTEQQTTLGFIQKVGNESRFYFTNTKVGTGRSARNSEQSEQTRKFYEAKFANMVTLNDVLKVAGCTIVHERPDDDIEYIDLSPENLDKTTLINLVL